MKVKFLMDYKTADFEVKANEEAEVKDELAELYIKNGVAEKVTPKARTKAK